MITYKRNILNNGLSVILNRDEYSTLVAVNLTYKVGSKNEQSDKTGFAHLFEHLMFSGTTQVPDFDVPVQLAGGENNAFTNVDTTSFYQILPLDNLELALFLESDRMKNLVVGEQSLAVQKRVVIEEFKESCHNTPYGDMWHHMTAMSYRDHPYRWPTIGIDYSHIENAGLDDVLSFYQKFYCPSNAVLSISGNIDIDETDKLVEKYFGQLPSGEIVSAPSIVEKPQLEFRHKDIHADIPAKAVYLGFRMDSRLSHNYYICDLISDILANGKSSRLVKKYQEDEEVFSEIDAYISGTTDPGLFIIEGRYMPNVDFDYGLDRIWEELRSLQEQLVTDTELEKVKNKLETGLNFSEVNVLNKAISLAYFECLGDISLINSEINQYQSISTKSIRDLSQSLFTKENCSLLRYFPN